MRFKLKLSRYTCIRNFGVVTGTVWLSPNSVFFFSGIRYPECIGVSHVSAGMRCHKMGHHFPHFPQVMDSIPPGEKQQKLQEFIDLIDPESLGAWMHRSGSVGYGKHLWLFFLGIHH